MEWEDSIDFFLPERQPPGVGTSLPDSKGSGSLGFSPLRMEPIVPEQAVQGPSFW